MDSLIISKTIPDLENCPVNRMFISKKQEICIYSAKTAKKRLCLRKGVDKLFGERTNQA
jgi:hypothetical protein